MSTRVEAVTTFDTKVARVTITRPANTTAYAAGDAIAGAANEIFSFPDALKPFQKSGSISNAMLISSANQGTKLDAELWLFSKTMVVVDNAAFAPADADIQVDLVAIIDFASGDFKVGNATVGAGGNAVCQVSGIGLAIQPGKRDLYGVLVARGTYTPVSGEQLTLALSFSRD